MALFPKGDDVSWYVPNVVPLESGQLSHLEYNDILTEFYDELVKPIADDAGIETKISSGHVEAADMLGEDAARCLRQFSTGANKSTGSSHPCDRERWLAFIYQACSLDESVDIGLLERLLLEQGWDERRANDLVIEFEFGRDLIKYMDENA